MDGGGTAETGNRKAERTGSEVESVGQSRTGFRERRRSRQARAEGFGENDDRAEPLDVLERAPRRTRADARPDRGTGRRFQGMHSRDQDGEDPWLPGRDEHDRL